MRRWPTWLVVGALVALGTFALADALRGSHGTEASANRVAGASTRENTPTRRSVGGVLYYTDENCVLRGIELWSLKEVRSPPSLGCRFSMSPAGLSLADRRAVWQLQGGLYAIDTRNGIELASPGSAKSLLVRGHAPAFKPDGTFTYVRDNEIVEWTQSCRAGAGLFTLPGDNGTARCRRIVLGRAVVRRDSRPYGRSPARIDSVAWLTNTRLAAALRVGARPLVVIYARGKRVATANVVPGRHLAIATSPRGAFISVWVDGTLAEVLNRDGDQSVFPPIPFVHALAWSPDERWAAVATRTSVFVFRPNVGEAHVRQLGILAKDLAWR